jgi:hypothetical protein
MFLNIIREDGMYNIQIMRSEDCVDDVYLDGGGDWMTYTRDGDPLKLEYESERGVLIHLSLKDGTVLDVHDNDEGDLPEQLQKAYELTN